MTSDQASGTTSRASKGTVLFYGLGSISVGIKNNLLGYFLLIYYNQALGLDALLTSSAMAVAFVFDAISDPLVGVWSDRLKTRWGRRHPFMYLACIPFALSYYMVHSDPGDISQADLYARLVLCLIVLRVSMTFYEVPRSALAPELTKDYDQRNVLHGAGLAFGWIGGAGFAFVAQQFFLDSFVDRAGYQIMAFWGGLGVFISCAVCSLGLHGEIPKLHVPEETTISLRKIFKQSAESLSNRSWLALLAAGASYALLVGIEQGAGTYYNEYLWQLHPSDVSYFSLLQALCVVSVSIVVPTLLYGFDKKRVAITIFLLNISIGTLPLILRLLDPYVAFQTFPENGTFSLWLTLLLHSGLTASLNALGMIFVLSMTMEVVEEVQRKTQRREEGLLATANSLIQKLIGAGGVLISGYIVHTAGFDGAGVTPEQMQGEIIESFATMHVAMGITLPLVGVAALGFYNITRARHEQNIDTLGYRAPSDGQNSATNSAN